VQQTVGAFTCLREVQQLPKVELTQVKQILQLAIARALAARGPIATNSIPENVNLGVHQLQKLHPLPQIPTAAAQALAESLQRRGKVEQELQRALRLVPTTEDDDGHFAKLAEQVGQNSTPIPPGAASLLEVPFDEQLLSEPLTIWPPQSRTIPRPHDLWSEWLGPRPSSVADVLTPEAYQKFVQHFDNMRLEMLRMRKMGATYTRHYAQTLALNACDIRAEFRGPVWDFRNESRLSDGTYPTLPPNLPNETHLDVDYLAKILKHSPSQSLRDGFIHGFRMHDDSPPSVVSPMHVKSLAKGLARAEQEFVKTDRRGWSQGQSTPCFIPGVFVSCGTAERKLEPDRPRFTMNYSAPEKEIFDTAGEPVKSINARINLKGTHREPWGSTLVDPDEIPPTGLLPRRYRFPREIKPTTVHVMHDGAVLLAAAKYFDLPLLRAQDDYKSFFWQFRMRSCDWNRQQFFWVYEDGTVEYRVSFVTAMGASHASNNCQDGSHTMDRQVMDVFDAQEAYLFCLHYESNAKLRYWLAIRNKVSIITKSNQARLYQICTFSDDPQIQAVGADRLVRLLKCFREVVCKKAGFIMASALKAEIGTSTTWIGHVHDSLSGMLILKQHKCLYALNIIHQALAGHVIASQWTDMLQLLQHLNVARLGETDSMYLLFDVVKHMDKNSLIPVNRFQSARHEIDLWIHVLTHTPAVSYMAAIDSARVTNILPTVPKSIFHLYTDAAKEGTDQPAMAGFIAGFYWYQPLSPDDLLAFSIPVLELAAIVISCHMVAERFPDVSIQLWSDSSTSVLVLQNAAQSAYMQYLHQMLLRSSQYRSLTNAGFAVGHISGDANVFADLPSRGYFDQLHRICHSLDMTPQHVPLSFSARQVLLLLRRFAQSRHASSVHVAQPFNLNGDGPQATAPVLVIPDREGPTQLGTIPRIVAPALVVPLPRLQPNNIPRLVAPALVIPELPMQQPWSVPRLIAPSLVLPKRQHCASLETLPRKQQRVDPVHLDLPAVANSPPAFMTECNATSLQTHFGARTPVSGSTVRLTNLSFQPPVGSVLDTLNQHLLTAQSKSYADSTLRNDRYAWDGWQTFCSTVVGTSPYRIDIAANLGWDHDGFIREERLILLFVVWKIINMKPRSNLAKVAKPSSAAAALSSVRRAHALTTGIELVKTAKVNRVVRGFLRIYIQKFGPESLMEDCKEPLASSQVRSMLLLPNGTTLPGLSGAHSTIQWSTPFFASLRALFATAWQTGFRKNELSVHDQEHWHLGRLSRGNVRYQLRGEYFTHLDATRLRLLADGDYVIIIPPVSKNDPFCQRFANKPIYLPFHNSPLSAAHAIRDLELRWPLADPALRHNAPLFATDAKYKPFRHSLLDKVFRAFIGLIVPRERVSQYSMHSFRSGLASALLLAGKSHPMIQALLRWASPESLSRYARLQPQTYGEQLIAASSVEITGRTSLNLPRLDNDDIVAQCQALLQQADADNA